MQLVLLPQLLSMWLAAYVGRRRRRGTTLQSSLFAEICSASVFGAPALWLTA